MDQTARIGLSFGAIMKGGSEMRSSDSAKRRLQAVPDISHERLWLHRSIMDRAAFYCQSTSSAANQNFGFAAKGYDWLKSVSHTPLSKLVSLIFTVFIFLLILGTPSLPSLEISMSSNNHVCQSALWD